MRLLHWLEIRNFKRFGDQQRIELDHPAVLIGPNNSGKTTAIQAIALWSQAVRTWFDLKGEAPPRERTSTGLNRLNIISVPVQRTRYFWHNAAVRTGNRDIKLEITLGVLHENQVEPVTMRFRNQGNELAYCTPDEATLARPELIERAAGIDVELLYPMSGIETEEPLLQPGRIDVLLGQGQTAQVLRNLCLMVFRRSPEDWQQITALMERLFRVKLTDPEETAAAPSTCSTVRPMCASGSTWLWPGAASSRCCSSSPTCTRIAAASSSSTSPTPIWRSCARSRSTCCCARSPPATSPRSSS